MDKVREVREDPSAISLPEQSDCGYQVGDLIIDLRHELVRRGAEEVPLARLSYDLLLTLVRAAPHVVSVPRLIDHVWAGIVVGPETVSQRIKLLRAALGDDAANPRYIASVRGRGYRLVAGVKTLATVPASARVALQAPVRRRANARLIAFAAAAAMISATAAIWTATRPAEVKSTTSPTQDPVAYEHYLRGLLARGSAATISARTSDVRAFENALSQAIDRDPGFAVAYAERAASHLAALMNNSGDAETHVEQARRDIEEAERLAPEDPKVLAARAVYLTHVEHDYAAAWTAFEAARAAGLADPVWIKSSAWTAWGLNRLDEALRIFERSVALDPRNASLIMRYAFMLEINSRPLDALRALELGIAHSPNELLEHSRGTIIYAWTGNLDAINSVVARFRSQALARVDSGVMLATDVWHARQNGRFQDMKRFIDALPVSVIRSTHHAAGMQPVARLRGWANLLLGDPDAAEADGKAILQFLHETRENRWNLHFRRLMEAEAYTFLHQPARATVLAREALRLAPPYRSLELDLDVGAVFAWNGAHKEAVQLIERLTKGAPVVGPALFVRDPLFTLPLAGNAHYRRVAAELETAIAAMKLPLACVQCVAATHFESAPSRSLPASR